MSSHSTKQAKIMSAISHGWRPEGGPVSRIPVKVAKEFHAADKGHKYGKGRAVGGVAPMMSQAFNSSGVVPGVGAMSAAAQPQTPTGTPGMGTSYGAPAVQPRPTTSLPSTPAPAPVGPPVQQMPGPVGPPVQQMPGPVGPPVQQMPGPVGTMPAVASGIMPNYAMPSGAAVQQGLSSYMMPDQQTSPGISPFVATPQPPGMSAPMGGARPLKRGGIAESPTHPDGKMTTGPLVSAVPGRTDLHFTHVPSGSYVIPADIVSKWGEGNTLAGIANLHKLFRLNTPGAKIDPSRDPHIGKPVKVKLAGGEIVVPPHNVLETMQRLGNKKLTLDEAHRAFDVWVKDQRKKLIKTLKSLPGPARD